MFYNSENRAGAPYNKQEVDKLKHVHELQKMLGTFEMVTTMEDHFKEN